MMSLVTTEISYTIIHCQAFFAFVLLFAVSIGQLFLKDTDFPRFPIWIVQFVLIAVLVFVGRYGKLKIDQGTHQGVHLYFVSLHNYFNQFASDIYNLTGLRKVCEDISVVHPGIVFQAKRIRSRSSQLYIEGTKHFSTCDVALGLKTSHSHGVLQFVYPLICR